MANIFENPVPLLSMLSDPTRRAIVEELRGGARAVGDLASRLPVSRPAVSQHLRVLSDCGMLTVTQQGTRRFYAIAPEAVAVLRAYVDQLWDDALSAYAAAAHQQATQEHKAGDANDSAH